MGGQGSVTHLSRVLGVIIVWTLVCAVIYGTGFHSLTARIISLDGEWQFTIDNTGAFEIGNVAVKAEWRTARVPLSWQAQFPDLRDYQGVAWYRKHVTLPRLKSSETVLIHFGAVDYLAEVYVNGHLSGRHEGGYTPFSFDVRQFVRKGENEITLRVMDPVDAEEGTEGINFRHIPHGKQTWYVQTSGMWQSAELQIRPIRHIKSVHVTPANDDKFTVDIFLSKRRKKRRMDELKVHVLDPQQQRILTINREIAPEDQSILLEGMVPDPSLWSFDTPNLYTLQVSLNGKDSVIERFGFRSIEAKNGRLYLNGEPFFLTGALDQDFYPETIYTSPSEKYLREEMVKAKKMGLNLLRCHVKIPDPLYLKVADEVGLLVWIDLPYWDVFTSEAARRATDMFNAMLERDWNHPSLVIISLINESWGIDLWQADQRAWLMSEFNRAKEKAVGRLVIDNSTCWGNFHVRTDINDYHTYWAIPENRHRFTETVNNIAMRPDWLFSPFGDSGETGEEPLLISEFGNWGLPKLPEKLPWWFERQFLDIGITLPEGVHDRFRDYQYEELFKDYDQLAEESQQAQYRALKYEIEALRLNENIQGYVITEFTDLNWECNGILDMWRNLKIPAAGLAGIQQQDVVIPHPSQHAYWEGDTAEVTVWLFHYSGKILEKSLLDWSISEGQRGQVEISPIDRAVVREIARIHMAAASSASPERLKMSVELRNESDGVILARNQCEFFVYPNPEPTRITSLSIHDPHRVLQSTATYLQSIGYAVTSPGGHDKVILTNVLDSTIQEHFEQGNTVICLVDSYTKLPEQSTFKLISRETEWYDGNWASNLNWVRSDRSPFREVGFGRHLGFESAGVPLPSVITGIRAEDFSDVLAGMFVGWIHLSSAYVLQAKASQGKLLIGTMDIVNAVQQDPFAASLLVQFIEYVSGPEFRPEMIWPLSGS